MNNDNTENKGNKQDALLEDYLAGTISKDSLNDLEQWAARSEDNRRYIRERLELWFSAGAETDVPAVDLNEKYKSLREQMAQTTRNTATTAQRRKLMLRTAACIAAIALIVLLPWAAYRQGAEDMREGLGNITMQTPAGAKTQLNLPDGTMVWLNADSRLTCSQGFGVSDRHISLTGEAYFNVARNEKLPFEINSRELDLKVLGTRFNYAAYPSESTIRVDLIEGSVTLLNNADGSHMTLQPGQRMTYNRISRRMTRRNIDTSMTAAWHKGRLHFDETPLSEIAATLSRTYGRKVSVEDRISNRRFYGSFDTNRDSLEDVLRMISKTNKVKYRYERGTYILY